MPKKIVKKKKSIESIIPIKIKKTRPESFWEEEKETERKEEKPVRKIPRPRPIKKKMVPSRQAVKKIMISEPKKSKRKYIYAGLIFLLLIIIAYLFFVVRPTLAQDYQKKGDLDLQVRAVTAALQNYQKALVLTPRNSEIYLKIGKIYWSKNLPKEAKSMIEKALSYNKENKEAYLIGGQIYLEEKDYTTAADYLKRFINQGGEQPEAYAGLIKDQIAQNKKEESADWAQKAFLLYPDNPQIIYVCSLAWFFNNDYQKAQKGWERLKNEKDYHDLAQLGIETINKLEGSSASYQKMLLGNFYNQNNLPSLALIYFDQVLKEVPAYRDAYLGKAEAYLLQKNYEKAKENLTLAQKQDPVYGLTFYLWGKILREQKDQREAINYFKKAQERGYDNALMEKELAESYLEINDYSSALSAYQKVLDFAPTDLEAQEKIIWLQAEKLNQPNSALKRAKEIELLNPQSAWAKDILAYALIMNNQLSLAKETIDKAISLEPFFALNYYYLGLLYKKQGNLPEAKTNFIKAADYDTKGNIFNQVYKELNQL